MPAPLDELSRQVAALPLRDRPRVARLLKAARQHLARGEPADKLVAQAEDITLRGLDLLAKRRTFLPEKIDYPPDLPVSQRRDDIKAALQNHQVVVLCGDTGSGKTTQLPKMCLELGRGLFGAIAHTQPRRIAARSVAARISDELDRPLGTTVGFKVRFADRTDPATPVRLLTDGMLLAEATSEPRLLQYDTVIVDEAHERSLNIDFLLGHLRNLLPRRPELKLVITSATIDPERFSKHFGDAPIVLVEGRTFPVEVRYQPPQVDPTLEDAAPALEEALVGAVRTCLHEKDGDVLVFLPGEREIRDAARVLDGALGGRVDVLPLFARLSVEEQMRVFQPSAKARRVVLSTNVAETSLTVPGIRSVVDLGTARVSRYSTRQRVQRLPIEPVSRASSDQRAGRCGRVGPGLCVRLFSEEEFEARPRFADPEIARTNLASVILQMTAHGLGRIEDFPFVDPPDYRQVRDGYGTLWELDAIDEHNQLTPMGRLLAKMPVDPRIARVILSGRDNQCLAETLVLAAALSVQDPRDRPLDKQGAADAEHARFREGASDFLTLLNLWKAYQQASRELSRRRVQTWCRDRFLGPARMREWADVERQLREIASDLGWELNKEAAEPARVHQAILPGLLSNVGLRDPRGPEYVGPRGRRFYLLPGSAAFHAKPKCVMAAELVETTRLYARTVGEIKPEWVERAAEHLVTRAHVEPHWVRGRGQVVAYESVALYGLVLVPKRPVNYGPVNPGGARKLFVQSALVEFDLDTDAAFYRHNRDLVRELELLEARTRRRDLYAGPAALFDFYNARLPGDVFDARSLDRWRRQAEAQDRRVLFATREDLLLRRTGELPLNQFPTERAVAGNTLPLTYRFEPGHAEDGVTLALPLSLLNAADPEQLDWLVPGLLQEKLEALIRTLPKALRVQLVPAPQVAERAARRLTWGDGPFFPEAARALGAAAGVTVRADDFQTEELHPYLKLNVRVVDDENRTVAMGRDLATLRTTLRERLRALFASDDDSQWHRDGLVDWTFGDLPPRLELRRMGRTVQAFPGLVDLGNAAGLRLFETPEQARAATREGVRRLFVIEYRAELKYHVQQLADVELMRRWYAPLAKGQPARDNGAGSSQPFDALMIEALAHRLITPDAADVRTRMEHELQLRSAWNRLTGESRALSAIARDALRLRHELTLRLDAVRAPLLQPAVRDLRAQLARLVPPDFLLSVPKAWLPHVPRFLKAADQRLTKLLDAGLKRDQAALLQVENFDWRLARVAETLPPREPWPAGMTEARWLLEELRVSLFAQNVGTSVPVSAKRVEGVFQDLERRYAPKVVA